MRINSPWGFPGAPVVKNLPCNAEDAGLTPGLGSTPCGATKIMHYNFSAHALEPESRNHWTGVLRLGPVLGSKRSPRNKPPHCKSRVAPARQNKRKPLRSKKDPAQPINK